MTINERQYKGITIKNDCLVALTEKKICLGQKLIQFYKSPLIQKNETYQKKSFLFVSCLVLLTYKTF